MPASLPPRPNLEWLRKAAKKRLALLRRTQPEARLADAQLAVAREYGFPSWRRLKTHVEESARGEEAADLVAHFLRRVGAGEVEEVRSMLAAAPSLIDAVGPHPFWGGRPQALHVSIETKRRDMFDLLLEHGADVDGSNDEYDHWSPLMLAAGRPEMRRELLRRGARVGLGEALILGDDARVEELLRGGRVPSGPVPNGGSWLAFARTTAAIDRLLEAGASIDARDRWGTAPIEALSRLGDRGAPLVRHLARRGAVPSPAELASIGDVATLARLVEADPGVAQLDAVMMAAVDARRHDLVAWLLERGGNPNARADVRSRHTALHAAAWGGDLAMALMLVEAGADPTIRDDEYDAPPIGWADTAIEVTNNPACAEVVAYLREAMG